MSKWNDFCKNVRQLTEKAIKKTEELTDVASLKIKIKTLEGKISEQYENLGALTYSSIKDGSDNKKAAMHITAKIDTYLADIAAYKLKLAKIEEESKAAKAQKTSDPADQTENDCEVESDAVEVADEPQKSVIPALSEDDDPKLDEAIRIVVESQKASTSLLQRKLEIGYGRAVKIIERMEELGVVGKANGGAPREVLIPCKTDGKGPIKKEEADDMPFSEVSAEDGIPQRNPFTLPTADEDEKLIEAIELAFENQKISTSMLQRRLGIGYGRAAKIIDRMEELGWISAPYGNSARNVSVNADELVAIKTALASK